MPDRGFESLQTRFRKISKECQVYKGFLNAVIGEKRSGWSEEMEREEAGRRFTAASKAKKIDAARKLDLSRGSVRTEEAYNRLKGNTFAYFECFELLKEVAALSLEDDLTKPPSTSKRANLLSRDKARELSRTGVGETFSTPETLKKKGKLALKKEEGRAAEMEVVDLTKTFFEDIKTSTVRVTEAEEDEVRVKGLQEEMQRWFSMMKDADEEMKVKIKERTKKIFTQIENLREEAELKRSQLKSEVKEEVKEEEVKKEEVKRLSFTPEAEEEEEELQQQMNESTRQLLEEIEEETERKEQEMTEEAPVQAPVKEKKFDKDGLSITSDEDKEDQKEVITHPKLKRKYKSPEKQEELSEKQKKALKALGSYNNKPKAEK